MTTFELFLSNFFANYGIILLGGLCGAIAYRAANKMTWKKFLGNSTVSLFLAILCGLICRNFTEWSNDMIFVVAAGGGFFSADIVRECKEAIDMSSDLIREKFGKKKEAGEEEAKEA